MDKTYFMELAAYNLFATNIVCSWLEKLSDEQWNAPVTSSFGSVRETALHIISSLNTWLERLHKNENMVRLEKVFIGSKEEHIILWKKCSGQFKDFIASFDETKLNNEISFKQFNGETTTARYYQVFAHTVNHSVYHIGQLVTLLRQVGFTDLQATGLINFYRIYSK